MKTHPAERTESQLGTPAWYMLNTHSSTELNTHRGCTIRMHGIAEASVCVCVCDGHFGGERDLSCQQDVLVLEVPKEGECVCSAAFT